MTAGPVIVAGFGFRKGATAASLVASLEAALALAQQGLPPVAALATAEDKAPALRPLAMVMGVPLVALPAAALAGIRTQTFSSFSLAAHGTGSVAEASALIAAGEGARLLGPRQISPDRMATCALAQGFST